MVRVLSAVIDKMQHTQRSFQPSMKVRIASVTCRMEVNEARRGSAAVLRTTAEMASERVDRTTWGLLLPDESEARQ